MFCSGPTPALAVQDNLPIHEDKVNGVYVKGVTEVYVASVEEVYEVLNRGSSNRVVAFTSNCVSWAVLSFKK